MDNGIHIIKASAGSGKTYTLAKDYIKLLLCHETPSLLGGGSERLKLRSTGKRYEPYHSHILAITFTNAATSEMKQRIIDQLYWLGQGDEKHCNYIADFKQELSYNDFSEVEAAARQALSDILFNYNTFNVSTIDSFFQGILRTFARELDCDYDYGIQLDDTLAQNAAISSLFATLGTSRSGYLDNWMKDYIEEQVRNNKNPSVYTSATKKDLGDFASALGKEEFSVRRDAIRDYLSDIGSGSGLSRIMQFSKAVKEAAAKLENDILAQDKLIVETLRNDGINSDNIHGNKGKFLKEMLGRDRDYSPSLDDVAAYTAKFPDEKKESHGYFFVNKAPEKSKDNFHNHVLPLLLSASTMLTRYKVMNYAKSNIWRFGLLGKIDDEIEKFRKENNVILLSDTNDMVRKVIESGVPFMYERVGTWINNFMIDEFQDTSDKQYRNFKTLLEESCGNGHNNLIIGDEKQSIYRFRNANPELLLNGIEADFGDRCHTSSIDHNYRSLGCVVDFNNEFFDKAKQFYKQMPETSGYAILQDTYRHIEQKTGKKSNDTGYVEFNFMPNSEKANTNTVPLLIEDLRRRGYRMSDIGVLVNRNEDGNKVVSNILAYNEIQADSRTGFEPIQIMSAESLKLVNSPQVRLIVSVLRFLDTTHISGAVADTTIGDAKPYRRKQFNDQRLYSIIHDFESKVAADNTPKMPQDVTDFGDLLLESLNDDRRLAEDVPQESERMKAYGKKVSGLLPDYHTEPMNLTSVVDRIIKHYVLFDNGDKGQNVNERKVGTSFLLAFQNMVNDFVADSSNNSTIREFLDYWDLKKDKLTVPAPSDADAVQVMTIHKSKGLQFKCVIIPYADWEMSKADTITWIPGELWVKAFGTDSSITPPMVPVGTSSAKGVDEFKQLIDRATQRSLIDNLNKAYVALTRAEREIYVFSYDLSETGKKTKSIGKFGLLAKHITGCMEGNTVETKTDTDADSIYTWYRGDKPDKVDLQHGNGEDLPPVDMPQYYVNIATPELLKVNLPASATAEQKVGTSLHRLLGRIGSSRDLERIITFGKARGIITDNQDCYWNAGRMEAALRRLVGEEPTSEWFAPENKAFNERSMTYADRNQALHHSRPDRVVRRPDGRHIVIDYKTGDDESPATIGRYKRQVAGYMQKVSAATGCNRVEGYIIYLQSWHIVRVEI